MRSPDLPPGGASGPRTTAAASRDEASFHDSPLNQAGPSGPPSMRPRDSDACRRSSGLRLTLEPARHQSVSGGGNAASAYVENRRRKDAGDRLEETSLSRATTRTHRYEIHLGDVLAGFTDVPHRCRRAPALPAYGGRSGLPRARARAAGRRGCDDGCRGPRRDRRARTAPWSRRTSSSTRCPGSPSSGPRARARVRRAS